MASAVSTLASSTLSGAPIEQPLAATIPPELLMQIFDAVQEQSFWREAQRERINQSKVCRSWYFARVNRNDYSVNGDSQAAALLKTFEANPARAAQVKSIAFHSVKDGVDSLLRLCVNVEDVALHCSFDLGAEVLASLPAGLRTLKLNIYTTENVAGLKWVPDLTAVPTGAYLEIYFHWLSARSADTERVLAVIEPVLPRIAELSLRHLGSKEQSTERGYLKELIPKLSVVEYLEFTLWQVHADKIAEIIAQLEDLEHLRIVDFDEEENHGDGLTPAIVQEIVKKAPEGLRVLVIGDMVMDWDAGWSAQKMTEIKKLAAQRGIYLTFMDPPNSDEDDSV